MTNHTWFFKNECPIRMVSFDAEVFSAIEKFRQRKYFMQLESCGILMGEKRGMRGEDIHIMHLSTPKITDFRTPVYYKRGVLGHQEHLNRLHGSSQGRVQYLGEWHTHPQKYAKPSSTDYREWHKTCKYFKDQPVLFFIAGVYGDWIGVQKNKTLYLPDYSNNDYL